MQQWLRLFCGRKWTDIPHIPHGSENNGKCVAKSSQEQKRPENAKAGAKLPRPRIDS
jgi:hypothetical protein